MEALKVTTHALKVTAPAYVHATVRGAEIMDTNADGSKVWTRKKVDDGNLEEFGWTNCPFCDTTVPDGKRCDGCGAERDVESGDWTESSDK